MTRERSGRGGTRRIQQPRREVPSHTPAASENKGLRARRLNSARPASAKRSEFTTAHPRPISVDPDPRCEACSFYERACLRHYIEALEIELLAIRATRKGGGK